MFVVQRKTHKPFPAFSFLWSLPRWTVCIPTECRPEYGMLRPLHQQAVADFIKQKQYEGTRMAKISFDRPLEVKNDKAASILIKAARGSRKPIKRIDISMKLESGRSLLRKRYFR
jgi:hypothetical protein